MCNICFPTCGRCRPISIVTFTCSKCGKSDSISREEYLMFTKRPHRLTEAEKLLHDKNDGAPRLCKGCGCNLYDVLQQKITPAACKRSNILCGFPCGRHTQDPDPENLCATMVPMGEYREEDLKPAQVAAVLSGGGASGRPAPPRKPGISG